MSDSIYIDSTKKIDDNDRKLRVNAPAYTSVHYQSYIKKFDIRDVISEEDFEDDIDFMLMRKMVYFTERQFAEVIKSEEAVSLPFLGLLSIDVERKEFHKLIKRSKAIRDKLDSTTYRNYMRAVHHRFNEKMKQDKVRKQALYKIKVKFAKKYNYYVDTLGKYYADVFILAISSFKTIEHNAEFEEQYSKVKDGIDAKKTMDIIIDRYVTLNKDIKIDITPENSSRVKNRFKF